MDKVELHIHFHHRNVFLGEFTSPGKCHCKNIASTRKDTRAMLSHHTNCHSAAFELVIVMNSRHCNYKTSTFLVHLNVVAAGYSLQVSWCL